jgi:PKD repeat protein
VSRENTAPVADFTVVCSYLTCGFTDRSTDPDAGDSLVSHAWDFGDGETSDNPTPFHVYAPPGGRFTVTLTVTDDRGAVTTAVKQVDVTEVIAPDQSGTYERETPHSTPRRRSRYVIRQDGTFELQEERESEGVVYTGRWVWGAWGISRAGSSSSTSMTSTTIRVTAAKDSAGFSWTAIWGSRIAAS